MRNPVFTDDEFQAEYQRIRTALLASGKPLYRHNLVAATNTRGTRRAKPVEERPEPTILDCERCGEQYVMRNSRSRYCSRACGKAEAAGDVVARVRRHRARKALRSGIIAQDARKGILAV